MAYLIYFHVLSSAGPNKLILVTFLIPISSVTLGIITLDEAITCNILLGACLVFLALGFIDGRLISYLKTKLFQ